MWLVHDMIEIERQGKPAVPIVSSQFQSGAKSSARVFGMPGLRYLVAPKIYKNLTPEQGVNQTREVFGELVRALTTNEDGHQMATVAVETDQLECFEGEDQLDALQAMNWEYLDKDWGDGFPLMPATPQAVAEMLKGTNLPPDHVLCDLAPGYGVATVQKIAVNAAMAGARPEHMPVIIGALKALSQLDRQHAKGFLMSTSSEASMLLVNGPIAKELGINSETCMGPGGINRANLAVGRAYTLCLKNIGHWYLSGLDMDTLGSVRKFTVCIAENEDMSLWEPFHVEKGFKKEASVVTLLSTRGEVDIGDTGNTTAEDLLKTIAYNSIFCQWDLHTTNEGQYERSVLETIVLVPPDIVRPVAEAGFTKRAAKEFIHHHAKFNLGKMMHHHPAEEKTINPEWRWLVNLSEKERDDIIMPVRESADRYQLICAGAGRAKPMIIPSKKVIPQSVQVDQYRASR